MVAQTAGNNVVVLPEVPPPPFAPLAIKGSAQPVIKSPGKPAPRSTSPKWEIDARDALKAAIRKFNKPLKDLVARDANEGDTRLLVTDFLTEGFGYDKYADLTTEYQVKGDFADYGIRIDKELVAFLETKRVATKLSMKHLRQVQMYAVNEGVEWLILTNGSEWQVYHLTGGLPVVTDLAFKVDLLAETTVAEKADSLFYLCRESLKRRQMDDLWKAKAASSPKSIGKVLLSEAVLKTMKGELRRQTGQRIEEAEIAAVLRETILRPECFES